MDSSDEKIKSSIKEQHDRETSQLPKKERKPFEMTPAREEQFKRCVEAKRRNDELRKQAKNIVNMPKELPVSKPIEEVIKPKPIETPGIPLKEEGDDEFEDLLARFMKSKPKRKRKARVIMIDSDTSSSDSEGGGGGTKYKVVKRDHQKMRQQQNRQPVSAPEELSEDEEEIPQLYNYQTKERPQLRFV